MHRRGQRLLARMSHLDSFTLLFQQPDTPSGVPVVILRYNLSLPPKGPSLLSRSSCQKVRQRGCDGLPVAKAV